MTWGVAVISRRALGTVALASAAAIAGGVVRVFHQTATQYPQTAPPIPSLAPAGSTQFSMFAQPVMSGTRICGRTGDSIMAIDVDQKGPQWTVSSKMGKSRLIASPDFVGEYSFTTGEPGLFRWYASSSGELAGEHSTKPSDWILATPPGWLLVARDSLILIDPTSRQSSRSFRVSTTPSAGSAISPPSGWTLITIGTKMLWLDPLGQRLVSREMGGAPVILGHYSDQVVGEVAIGRLTYFFTVNSAGVMTWLVECTNVYTQAKYHNGLLAFGMDGGIHVLRVGHDGSSFHVPDTTSKSPYEFDLGSELVACCRGDRITYYTVPDGEELGFSEFDRPEFVHLQGKKAIVRDANSDAFVTTPAHVEERRAPILRHVTYLSLPFLSPFLLLGRSNVYYCLYEGRVL